ncbi:D-2-hydroxyacid dehydrogenase [Ornithinibacillus halotolerans]|uniref:Glycerate dehydrogenase n=1 Tax=Ornithinibacillus halotolerans TaxID=1274357 RepID=A0A916WDB1_9BACI|nr:D-2-hydroxyacid dehydrogenase [Ornithinibacillus halotolerans]GGA89410.1 glycerate dehydrogenase [Ornithinibacillus halotolerans]
MVILFTAKLSEKHKEKLVALYSEVEFIFANDIQEAEKHLDKAEVVVTYGADLDEEKLSRATNLKWIMVLSAGVDQLPLKQIEERGIVVTNSSGIHKVQMAEYTISMLLQVYRQEQTFFESQKNHHWNNSVKIKEISEQTMLVLGTGAIGEEIARLGKAFRMKTIGISRSGNKVDYFDEVHKLDKLMEVLPQADFVVSVLPGTKETQYLLNKEHFKQMRNSAVFVNIGRGNLVKSEDILYAIQQEEIAHVILDVFEQEPLPEDHPFWNEPNITMTPHISGNSPKYMTRALAIFEENLNKYMNGDTNYINTIDPSRGY